MPPRYFHCDHNHGIFVSPNKVAKAGAEYKPRPEGEAAKRLPYKPVVNHGKVSWGQLGEHSGYLLWISTLDIYSGYLLQISTPLWITPSSANVWTVSRLT